MRWLRLVGSLKLKVSCAKQPYKTDDSLQKRPMIWRNLLIVTGYKEFTYNQEFISTQPVHLLCDVFRNSLISSKVKPVGLSLLPRLSEKRQTWQKRHTCTSLFAWVVCTRTCGHVRALSFGNSFWQCHWRWGRQWGGGLGSRSKKMYGERLGDGVEYHLMSPTPRR